MFNYFKNKFNNSEGVRKKMKPYEVLERINEDSINAASFYSERNDVPIILGNLPDIIFR